ncbi:hypothetical protein ACFS7Z_14985 [Pontibacter toksunensis]|uniref:SWFGD domain-containing protein n=1 Tax=Pontibacter toksunensis TaxID=1332631 RepID=A0ABW6BWH1_9BACT
MERDDQYYNRDYRNNNRNRNQGNRKNDEQFENYRDRYSSGGNYYGMRDEDAEYRNVRSTGSNTYGAGPVGGYGSSSYRGTQDNDSEQYRYGDPNPHMDYDRNGGYERTRGTGWRDNNDRYTNNTRNNINDSGRDQGRDGGYSRGDNSYQYSGSGRRYGEFGTDEGRTYNRDRNSGYNMGTEDSYYDRSDFKYDRSDNDFRGTDRSRDNAYSRDNDRYLDDDDFRYSGRIQNSGSDRDDNYATGLYASNRSYLSDQQSDSDGDRVSSRHNRHGRSGPDYRASSAATNYSENGGEVRG